MRLAAAVLATLTIGGAILWWRRAWAQYQADDNAMAAAMHERDNSWDSDCN